MKEEALRNSEQQLEADAIRFDAFLKENDRLAHEALSKAENEARLKAEMVQEIKKIKHSIGIMEAEKAKLRESLDDNEKYRIVSVDVVNGGACVPPDMILWTVPGSTYSGGVGGRAEGEEEEEARAEAPDSAWRETCQVGGYEDGGRGETAGGEGEGARTSPAGGQAGESSQCSQTVSPTS